MRSLTSSRGFSLIEVMVASAILGCAVLSIAQLVVSATASTAGARGVSESTLLAWQKIDQLRSLAYAFDDAGLVVTDPDLSPSPAGTLVRDIDGYVDYLDAFGEPLGRGDEPPRGTRYRRRWSLAFDGGDPDVLVLRVHVLATGSEGVLASATTLRSRRRP